MHQIHHSTLPRHRDKNLGAILSLWDYLFGTLYVPQGREEFPLGISCEEVGAANPHTNIAQILIEPVTTAWQTLQRPTPPSPAAAVPQLRSQT
jgi:hypothetical protein